MKDNAEILKLRVLLCFWKLSPADRSVTGIARTLDKEKYAVSRAVSSLEKDGLVQRENARSPQLTEAGRQAASRYSERFETALNHLLYEGVDLERPSRTRSSGRSIAPTAPWKRYGRPRNATG